MASITTDPHEAYVLRVDSAGLDRNATNVVAAAGTAASGATVITAFHNVVTGATGAAGVALPAAATNAGPYTIINDNINYALLVYPVSGGNDNINDLSEDTAFILARVRPLYFRLLVPLSGTQTVLRICQHGRLILKFLMISQMQLFL